MIGSIGHILARYTLQCGTSVYIIETRELDSFDNLQVPGHLESECLQKSLHLKLLSSCRGSLKLTSPTLEHGRHPRCHLSLEYSRLFKLVFIRDVNLLISKAQTIS